MHLASSTLSGNTGDGIRLFPTLNIAYRAQRKIGTQRPEIAKHRPRPPEGVRDERNHGEWKPEVSLALLLQRENTRHEELEDDECPQESVEGDPPGFSVGLVRLEVDYLSAPAHYSRDEPHVLKSSLYL